MKTIYKNYILGIMSVLAGFMMLVALPAATFAADVTTKACLEIPDSAVCRGAQKGVDGNNPLFGPQGILTRAVDILSTVAGVIAVIVLIIAGIRFITSQNEPQKISSARNQIIYALVGLVVVALSQALVAFVLKKL